MTLETRQLGNTSLQVSVLGLGTWGLCDDAYGPVSDTQATNTLQRAYENGIRLLDMAPTWGPDGRAERCVAQALSEHRDELTYVTRAGFLRGEGGLAVDFSDTALRASCESSLKRLGTDHLDVWLLHQPTPTSLQESDARDTCEALLREGKIRAWGASVSDAHAGRAAIQAGAQVLCLPHNLVRPELLWTLQNEITGNGVGVLASSPMCHGLLAGRWSPQKGFPSNDHRARRWSRDALAARVAAMQALRKRVVGDDILSLASGALRFVAAENCVSSVVLGCRAPGQLELSVHSLGEPPYMGQPLRDALRAEAGF